MESKNTSTDLLPNVKNIVAIASGKGGVGKSTIAANLAVALSGKGLKVGLLDADIFGPSIPKMFGMEEEHPKVRKESAKDIIIPVEEFNVKLLSIGFFISKYDATIWRGPLASKVLKQLIIDTDWGELDYLIFDLPPGTSDIHLTLVQTLPVTGAIIVSTPQNVALADAIKGIMMFKNEPISVPILGIVENMSWFIPSESPEKRHYIFGKDGCKRLAKEFDVPLLGQIPLIQEIREGGDFGKPAALENSIPGKAFKELARKVQVRIKERNMNNEPTKVVEVVKK
jgi:ATP-binding protein involved in chromosome partitioning